MKFTKPAWVVHKDTTVKGDQMKRLSIFSVHVHPDDSRIATGGLDAKVRIWSTKPILNEAAELANKPPKQLCALTMHTGPVLCVRWANSGRWLASGSDDQIVMIWDLDPAAKGKVWGSDEVNVEGWKPLKRLPGHESDVTDLAWSPEDRYLASVGLDSQVLVWCGFTLERLRKLSHHQGFVKGVCWDPVGEFLATQSDDRSVKIWRTKDWQMEAEVRKPFDDSPGSTFFRRLSWSPDGAHITASNATNNKGYVFIAAVISRNTWTSEISLVGHENTVEVACYNPHIFLRNPDGPVQTANICSVVALGADDRSVSVWQTKSARPLIVAREAFERQVMDLSWSWSGLTLYACSSDGTLGVFNFERSELEGIAPFSAQQQYLKKFGFEAPPIPEGFSHTAPAENQVQGQVQRQTPDFGAVVHATANGGGGEKVNKLVAKRKDKRAQMNGVPSASVPSATNLDSASSFRRSASVNGLPPASNPFGVAEVAPSISNAASSSAIRIPPPPLQTVPPSRRPSGSYAPSPQASSFFEPPGFDYMDVDVNGSMEVPIESLPLESRGKGKQRADSAPLTTKPRTLGGDRVRENIPVREIPAQHGSSPQTAPVASGSATGIQLVVPPVLTYLSAQVEGSDDLFECRNGDADGAANEVIYVSGKQTQWLDYLQERALSVVSTSVFCAAAMVDGSINVYSLTGRRLMPTICLGSPCAFLDGNREHLMALNASGMLYVWNTKKQKSSFQPISVLPMHSSIASAALRPNGVPMIQTTDSITYAYDASLSTWIKMTDHWWAQNSDVWQGRQRSTSHAPSRGIVAAIESDLRPPDDGYAPTTQAKPAWWNTALTLGHLETRLHTARVLESPSEYKQWLLVYAKKIAEEGFRAKAEELIKELFGPVYWRLGRDDSWAPTVLGFSKRDLLREVLNIFVRSKTLTKLAMDWQDVLRKAGTED